MSGQPVILFSSVDVPSNADTEAPAGPLINATGEGIEVHQIKFSLRPSNRAIEGMSNESYIRPASGGQFGVTLAVKNDKDEGYALTKGLVPLWSFGPSYGLADEVLLQLLSRFNAAPNRNPIVPVSTYIWKLDYPLYIPPGARLVPTFRSIGSFQYDVLAGITVIGQTVAQGAQQSYRAPWVASYLSSSDRFDDLRTEISSPKQLQNSTNKPVFLKRLTGRLHLFKDAGQAGSPFSFVSDTSFFAAIQNETVAGSAESWFSRCFSVQIADSMGNPLVRVPTPFRNVFDATNRTWNVQHTLPPQQFLRVTLAKNNDAQTPVGVGNVTRCQVSVTMVGYREVSWQGEV